MKQTRRLMETSGRRREDENKEERSREREREMRKEGGWCGGGPRERGERETQEECKKRRRCSGWLQLNETFS